MKRTPAGSLFLAALLALGSGCGARAQLESSGGSGGSGGSSTTGGPGSSGPGGPGSSGPGGPGSSGPGGPGSSGPGGPGSSGPGGPGSSGPGGPGSSGSVGSSGVSGSSGSGGPICPSFGDACSSCLSTGCSDLYCSCFENPECLALIKCDNACGGDAGCKQTCSTQHQAGNAALILLGGCGATTCAATCPGTSTVTPCGVCILQTCEAQANACFAEPQCLLLFKCLQGCGQLGLACQQQCYADHGAGVPTLQAMLDCSAGTCGPICK